MVKTATVWLRHRLPELSIYRSLSAVAFPGLTDLLSPNRRTSQQRCHPFVHHHRHRRTRTGWSRLDQSAIFHPYPRIGDEISAALCGTYLLGSWWSVVTFIILLHFTCTRIVREIEYSFARCRWNEMSVSEPLKYR